MLKFIQLKLSKIKCSGDSIGVNLYVEIEVLGKFLRIDKRMKADAVTVINQEVGRFETDRGIFYAHALIAVIEKDLLFNDVGSTKGAIKINTDTDKPQQFIFKVPVRETRSILGKFWGGKTANFEITLEAVVTDAARYIPNNNEGGGWLKVRIEDRKTIESLPAFLKVKSIYDDGKREYFTPLEGVHRDTLVSAKLQDNGSSHLISGITHELAARAVYSISKKTFAINDKRYATVDYKDAPWKKGLYDIEMPDYPHALGARYEKQAPRSKTWFRVGHRGEKYIHAGGQSLGCITVVEIKQWEEIYNALIKARKGDRMSVGVLEVID